MRFIADPGPEGREARCGIAIMAKASRPGRCKTRLVPPLDFDAAAALNTVFLRDIGANIAAAAPSNSVPAATTTAIPNADVRNTTRSTN